MGRKEGSMSLFTLESRLMATNNLSKNPMNLQDSTLNSLHDLNLSPISIWMISCRVLQNYLPTHDKIFCHASNPSPASSHTKAPSHRNHSLRTTILPISLLRTRRLWRMTRSRTTTQSPLTPTSRCNLITTSTSASTPSTWI